MVQFSVNKELAEVGFTYIPKDADEDEHSIEMHLPYVAKVMEEWVDDIFSLTNIRQANFIDSILVLETNSLLFQ